MNQPLSSASTLHIRPWLARLHPGLFAIPLGILGLDGAWQHLAALPIRAAQATANTLLAGGLAILALLSLLRDAHGRQRLARVYGFEFTVTGEQRHVGSISMFGQHLGQIELDAHPFSANPEDAPAPANVVQLNDWRQRPPPPY